MRARVEVWRCPKHGLIEHVWQFGPRHTPEIVCPICELRGDFSHGPVEGPITVEVLGGARASRHAERTA